MRLELLVVSLGISVFATLLVWSFALYPFDGDAYWLGFITAWGMRLFMEWWKEWTSERSDARIAFIKRPKTSAEVFGRNK